MRILVTGGAGYLGSVLVPKLLARGHQVRVLDVGYFGLGHLRALRPVVEIRREDVRHVAGSSQLLDEVMEGCDSIIHLAAISNDPSAELDPELTDTVNFRATLVFAERARTRRLRFLFSSSCSVYGTSLGEVDETAALDPLTTYAISKVKAEDGLRELTDATWKPVVLRNGTLYGYSPRMRFDLVPNVFSLYSTLYNEIRVFGEGTQWRPFLHVSDCARALIFFAERNELRFDCYNVAGQNLRVVDLAGIFRRINPNVRIVHLETPDRDQRDYRVSFARARAEGFEARVDIQDGVEAITEAIISGLVPDPESIFYRNAKWLKELSQAGGADPKAILSVLEGLAHMQPYARGPQSPDR